MSSLSADERKALVRRYLETAWNTQVSDERDEGAWHATDLDDGQQNTLSCTGEQFSPAHVYLGDEPLSIPLAELRTVARTTFPDIHLAISDLVVEEEKVVVRWFLEGTDLGGFEGHLPTGRLVRLTGITIMRMEQDIIVEEWNEIDLAGMLRQLGFVYTPQPPRITMRRPGPPGTSRL
jgi:predicted ester cyclase